MHQIFVIEAAGHVHVDARKKSFAGRGRTVVCDAVRDKLADRGPVTINETLESPFLP